MYFDRSLCVKICVAGLIALISLQPRTVVSQNRIISDRNVNGKRETKILDANGKVRTLEVYAPATPTKNYLIRSDSSDPVKDFADAIAEARTNETPAFIKFDGGVYNLGSISGNVYFPIADCSDIIVNGNGSTLKFSDTAIAFGIFTSERIKVTNFKLTYETRVASPGRIKTINGKKAIRLAEGYVSQMSDARYQCVSSIHQRDPNDAYGAFDLAARRRWIDPNRDCDSDEDRAFSYDANEKAYVTDDASVLRDYKNGDHVLVKHFDYANNAFSINRCNDVTINNITASDVPGMFLFARKIDYGLLVSNCVLQRDPDDTRSLVSSGSRRSAFGKLRIGLHHQRQYFSISG